MTVEQRDWHNSRLCRETKLTQEVKKLKNDYTKIAEQYEKHGTVQGVMHYVNEESIKEQHKNQPKHKAKGVDEIGKEEYEENLGENAKDLIYRMKKFKYKPQPVRRVYIPKPGSEKKRPIGIPAYEDKLVQGVFAEILNEIYERIFLECSFGFREGRDCHQAVKELDNIIMRRKVNYIVDADISGFFDNVSHEWLVKFLEHTIQDKNFIRYIVRFLKSGIMEQGKEIRQDVGTPQRRHNKSNTSKCIFTLCT